MLPQFRFEYVVYVTMVLFCTVYDVVVIVICDMIDCED